MKVHIIKFFVWFLLFVIYANGKAQDVQISTITESIQVHNDTTYTVNVSVVLKANSEPVGYPIFYDLELEQISDIKVYHKKRNLFRIVKDPNIKEETIDLDYITSKKVKSIFIPADTETKITYKITCNELMYFADLRFFSYFETDTIRYVVTVPETFRFLYTSTDLDLLEHLSIDSVKTSDLSTWNIEVVPIKVEPDPLMFFGIYRNQKLPVMRTVVVTKSYENKGQAYINDWFLQKSESSKGLDSVAMKKIDELTQNITDTVLVMETIYDYVKANFKYVSIQIGLGAFIPSHANDVFLNKQGDCKDLSNFLCEALNYKGIEGHLALAATYNHFSDCDFPSLGSANHIVCVAYIDGKPIILDPTDPIHTPNMPVQSIQGRTILIMNSNGGKYYKAETSSAMHNMISYKIELNACSDQSLFEGGFSVKYEGISGNFLKRSFLHLNDDKVHRLANQHYEMVFNKQSVSEISISNQQQFVAAEGELKVNGKIFNDGNKQLLFVDFLPRLIESEQRGTLLDGTYIGNTINKKVELQITMDRNFEPFEPINHTYEENGVALNLTITNPSDKIIRCEYDFIIDHIFMGNENTDTVNQILNVFKRLSNDPIIINGKS